MIKISVVIPNWNGVRTISDCLNSLSKQTLPAQVIVVDNGSTDKSVEVIKKKFQKVELITLPKNRGFAGGVNYGIRQAIESGSKYVALLNNDAVADRSWLKTLVNFMESNPKAGIVTAKMLDKNGKRLDSTGEAYTVWGLPYPRGLGEPDLKKYDGNTW